MSCSCGCCDGPHVLTPGATVNRSGLGKLSYRVGTHATFFETMQARLSCQAYPALAALKTREKSDPSIALLDAWATVGDVLTFYQERIANEGYLRTATERRSVLELAALIGYVPRPGVAASVYLAYTLDKDTAPVEIPKGARSNSIPDPGEQMQAFETAEPLMARVEWNAMKPRLTKPQLALSKDENNRDVLYFVGTATDLKSNDRLIVNGQLRNVMSVEADATNERTKVVLETAAGEIVASMNAAKAVVAKLSDIEAFNVSADTATTTRVLALLQEVAHASDAGPQALAAHLENIALPAIEHEVQLATDGHFTKLLPWVETAEKELKALYSQVTPQPAGASMLKGATQGGKGDVGILSVVESLKRSPSVTFASAKQLPRSTDLAFAKAADTVPQLLTSLVPSLGTSFYRSWANYPVRTGSDLKVYAMRVTAAPFGHNAPLRLLGINANNVPVMDEWVISDPLNETGHSSQAVFAMMATPVGAQAVPVREYHRAKELYLDNDYDIAPDSIVAIEKENADTIVINPATSIVRRSFVGYGLSGKTVQIKWDEGGAAWITDDKEPFSTIRSTRVFAGSEALALAEVPIADDVAGGQIELGALYDGLQSGRWLIVAGERSDIIVAGEPVAGVKAAELVMIQGIEQAPNLSSGALYLSEKIHTVVVLANELAYRYKRDTVTIYGNVVKATNGETRQEVLGAGDAAKALQTFTLKQSPLTFVSAPTVAGVQTTLEVRVNDVQWHEANIFAALAPNDRKYITRTDDDAKTSVVFGDGEHGLRLPTGVENVKATYRNGIGKPGNVKAGQITLLATRPLGVKEVLNPIRASGGADKETRDQARKNAPLAVMALDRLVSTRDYADFARVFAGVGKAAAARQRQSVRVVIAGVDDIPIETTSDLYRNLRDSLYRFGDPYLPIDLVLRERLALVVSAKVRIDPDYQWDTLEPKLRAAMLDRFGFERLELGEDLLLSYAVSVLQNIPGVSYVDVDVFATVTENDLLTGFTQTEGLTLGLNDRVAVDVTQIAYLVPEVADTLILQELKP